ncbi:hypothetical protein AMECASPLE_026263 [Ameca splendens]|uniref:Secreted protein n=1 Tax=Ameca splendens TaxID=208324 RepID=A0ABV0YG00_9TELE
MPRGANALASHCIFVILLRHIWTLLLFFLFVQNIKLENYVFGCYCIVYAQMFLVCSICNTTSGDFKRSLPPVKERGFYKINCVQLGKQMRVDKRSQQQQSKIKNMAVKPKQLLFFMKHITILSLFLFKRGKAH